MRSNVSRGIDGYDRLIEGICHQAAQDIRSGNDIDRDDAIWFFRSKWFEYLTDLDGDDIVKRLLDEGGSK